MKLMYVKLCNYIGIYNGIGQESIEIDFTKSKNKIIAIKGNNGSGKSTLLRALSPFADDNSQFIPGTKATKCIVYENNGIRYDITYIHDIKADGTRDTTKGQIRKNSIILNSNWNVSTCKELIFSIFNLDSNFISLSQLSSDDRGLADKRPAERKKFVNSILENLSVYNDMYKTLSKKASIVKATMASLNSKIGSLGKKDELLNMLTSINKQIAVISNDRDGFLIAATKYKTMAEELDPNGKIEEQYKLDVEQLNNYIASKDEALTELKHIRDNDPIREVDIVELLKSPNVAEVVETINKLIQDKTTLIEVNTIEAKSILDKLNDILKIKLPDSNTKYNTYLVELESLSGNIKYDNPKEILDAIKAKLSKIKLMFKTLHFSQGMSISSSEISIGISIIRSVLDKIKEVTHFDLAFNDEVKSLEDIISLSLISQKNKDKCIADKDMYSEALIKAETRDTLIRTLALRPDDCKIDSCPFIKNAIDASKSITEDTTVLYYTETLKMLNDNIKKYDNEIRLGDKAREILSVLNTTHSNLLNAAAIIELFPLCGKLLNRPFFNKIVMEGSYYEYEAELDRFSEAINLAKEYKVLTDSYNAINEDLVKNNNNIVKINSIKQSLKTSKEYIDSLIKDSDIYTANLDSIKTRLVSDTNDKQVLESYKLYYMNLNNAIALGKTFADNVVRYSDSIDKINDLKVRTKQSIDRTNDKNRELSDATTSKSKITYALTLLDEYSKELGSYMTTYDKIEKVKYYTSPTTGIQTIFMEAYMNNIIVMANELLQLMFNGEYLLRPFIINETEFRIPCSGDGYINDDISSMSTSQICMISMILSFAILHFASSDYNILKLDEIDGGLDTVNRLQFIRLLEQLMTILQCEQCIMISHNSELATDDIDLIILTKGYDITNCNVIYQP